MAITRVQKSGRINGQFPTDDARIIDQFMDEVIATINQTIGEITIIINEITILNNNPIINRCIAESFTIVDPTTVLQRNPVIKEGVTITIETGGELLLL